MRRNAKISSIFPKHLFWDLNYERLDVRKDRDIIIPRALYMTNKESFEGDIKKLEDLYSSSEIVRELMSTKERISNEVCELVANRYHVPPFHRYPVRK